MFTTLFSLSLLITLFHSVFAQSGFEIDTPELVQCQPAQLTWTATDSPPYDLLIVSAQDMCGEALEDLGNQTSTDLTWTVNLAAGTEIVLSLLDSAGNEAWSGTVTIGSSNDTSCLASTSSSAAPSASASSTSAAPLTVLPSGGTTTQAATSSLSPKSSASGTATAGLSPTSGALSTRPLGIVTLFSSAVLAVAAFAL